MAEAVPRAPSVVGVLQKDSATTHDTAWQRVLDMGRGPRLHFPVDQSLAALIEAQVARTPQAVCAVHGGQTLRYAELDQRAQSLATRLLRLGVAPGEFVAIVHERGLDFLVAMLGVWKAAAAYVPVDPSYPVERVRYMLQDSQASVAIVSAKALHGLLATGGGLGSVRHTLCMQDLPPLPSTSTPPLPHAAPHSAAYMLYTSGSSGRPKGAIVRHDGAVNHVYAQAHALGVAGISRFLQSAPSSSDISVWQFAGPLLFGGYTVIHDDITDVALLLRTVQQHQLSIIELVPVVMKYFIDYAATLTPEERALPHLRWAMVTGESASVDLVNAWLRLWPHIPVVNAYGPTEAADDVVQAILREPLPPGTVNVPIGRPLANLDIFVLDERLQAVPLGATGEICIAGVGVGAGYWQQPLKTQQSFVANPFAKQPGALGTTLYRSGDLGRWREDGLLECLGRKDDQVQLRGQRIELQEIEAVLREHAGVRDTVVQLVHAETLDAALAAYVVWRTPEAADEPALRSFIATRLPAHMLPRHVVALACLPLNPAGKVDRRALPLPADAAAVPSAASAPPGDGAEATLLHIWQQEFGRADIHTHDNFFDLGGDSLHALGIVVGARAAGLELRTADVLDHPSVAALAQVARRVVAAPAATAQAPALPAIKPLDAQEVEAYLAATPELESLHPLTPPQQAVFMHWMLARDKTTYVDQYCFELEGELDADAWRQAWQLVAQRHRSLRTGFVRSALSQPVQAVHRAVVVPVQQVDARELDAAAVQALAHDEVRRSFTLASSPPMRLLLLRLGASQHRLVWTHHHIVLDGWSMGLVLQEVLLAHAHLSQGQTPLLPAPADTLPYLLQLAALDVAPAQAYWQEMLRGYTGTTSWPPAATPASPAGYGQWDVELDAAALERLAARARRGSWTLTTVLQAAWAATLGRAMQASDLVLGVVTSGRELAVPGIAAMVGMFVTTLPLRVDLNATRTLEAWLDGLQARAVATRQYEQVPLSHIARWSDLEAGGTLFDSLFVMANYPGVAGEPGAPLRLQAGAFRTVPAYALTLVATVGTTLQLRLVHELRRLDTGATQALAQALHAALVCLADGGDPRGSAPRG
jgi:amino acid adenylation domain-containing protein